MNISISFHSETVPDYARGETESRKQSFDLFFDGKDIEVYSEFMDRIDKKEAVGCIRSVLDLYEKKEVKKMTNDRFRYRIYDVENKKYVENPEDFVPCDLPDGFIAEQCTGWTDKNGVLIFEGDVMLIREEKMRVEWIHGMAGFILRGNTLYSPSADEYNVIGNIHESGDK